MLCDANFHLPTSSGLDLQDPVNKLELDSVIEQEFNINQKNLKIVLEEAMLKSETLGLSHAHYMILDESAASSLLLNDFSDVFFNIHVSLLMNFRRKEYKKVIDEISRQGAVGIKLHPYLQEIIEKDYNKVLEVVTYASEKKLIISVDCSYGTKNLYKSNGVHLIAFLLSKNIETKIIALHFGGPKVLDVMSLMAQHTNLYSELSLSLSYWKGSSVWQDLCFAIKKVGAHRFMFGSDQPFIEFSKALHDFNLFCEFADLSNSEMSDLSSQTYLGIFEGQ
ncbi:amidohydrolase family protein [Pseudoalteromonas sp. SA25]|uniref:amidohydrolase family protein n=1 Tax=Pseudoalteromonas sp. SA25 TaxID=2686347 RepID=UPI0013FE4095|nr:amidohydrolase family protein [Pseudoalteromonas sp. SA25]